MLLTSLFISRPYAWGKGTPFAFCRLRFGISIFVLHFVFVSLPLFTAAFDDVFELSSHQNFKSGPVMLCRLANVHCFLH